MLYEHATVETYHADVGMTEDTCDVRIGDGDIVVDGGDWMYRGKEEDPGHYRLECRELEATATLHRFKGASVLVGNWIEEGQEGMWLIRLGS